MMGLLEKDIRLIMQRKQMVLVFIALAIVLGFTMDGPFILGYLPFLTLMVLLSTISYDELDNGFMFLLTLPITAKTYVVEKYVFCMGGVVISWVISAALYVGSMVMRSMPILWMEEIPIIVTFLPLMVLMLDIMIPLQMKFGVEKSRIVIMGVAGVVALVGFLLSKISLPDEVGGIFLQLNQVSDCVIVVAGIVITILATVISLLISCRIMKHKEF